ncbi:MAG TPA: DUF3644 domain-containing protein [Planctomycetaceae bacterium]|nr:DUF3644 domain-containing protein [Planctomycetaceae bacterium]
MGKERNRRIYSIKSELIEKSREAALSAVQIFNNPLIRFKSETFIVLMIIAWTYLLHAYYRSKKIEHRHHEIVGKRKKFDKTTKGAYKRWGLEHCLSIKESPVDKDAANNLRFLIGIRHEIEHQMTMRIDAALSAKFQACCLNYNELIKTLFGDQYGIDHYLSFSLQFSSISEEQILSLPSPEEMPANIQSFIEGFDGDLSEAEFNSPKYAYRVIFTPKLVNHKGQADQVIEFIKEDSPLAKEINASLDKTYTVIKETEKKKYLPKNVVEAMKAEGFFKFSIHNHTQLWQSLDAKNPKKNYGVLIQNVWYWYEPWVEDVRKHCQENSTRYGKK